jgi:hypothetical protein
MLSSHSQNYKSLKIECACMRQIIKGLCIYGLRRRRAIRPAVTSVLFHLLAGWGLILITCASAKYQQRNNYRKYLELHNGPSYGWRLFIKSYYRAEFISAYRSSLCQSNREILKQVQDDNKSIREQIIPQIKDITILQ